MTEIFKSHREITEEDFEELWKKALFIFDTNTLLDVYRLPESAKIDFLNILSDKKIKDRVWLPFQVILEFTQNRLDIIGDQKGKFSAVQSIINAGIEDLENTHQNLRDKINKLQLKKRHSVIDPDKFINDDLFKESKEKLQKFLGELKELDKQQPDVNDKDETQKSILKIFENKIGTSFNLSELDEIYKEGENRYKEDIPPGFKDKDKPGFYLFEDKKYIRKFGDLVAW
ncbi:MAG TPA: PIN-like domain-containing protein, partial [Flavobacterium sp.]|nr:PIN-like domain-containing protein [Flavobacterium sp.]